MRPIIVVSLLFIIVRAVTGVAPRPAIIIEGSAMTPLKETADWLGASIVRDIPRGDFVLWRGSKEFFRMPCLVWHEKAYISLRALAVQLQGKLSWDDTAQFVTLHPGEKTGLSDVTYDLTLINPVDGAELVWVAPGEFIMGTGADDLDAMRNISGIRVEPDVKFADETPRRAVKLDGFWVYRCEVTTAQYRRFCTETKREMPPPPAGGWHDDNPVVNVSRVDAEDYAKWAEAALPTEEQWEKAARGTDGRLFPWGNSWDPLRCNAWNDERGLRRASAAGSYAAGASPCGALDMAGNAAEWCLGEGWPVIRGASWATRDAAEYRCAARGRFMWETRALLRGITFDKTSTFPDVGFRCIQIISDK
jgi:formylglycine-generating enzyme required for sulfatase activity